MGETTDMPKRFMVTDSPSAQGHKESVVKLIWSGGQVSILSLELKKVGNSLEIPFKHTLLMMGTTPELAAELEHLKTRRIQFIAAEVPQGAESFIIPMAARKRTADPLGVHPLQKLSVIAIYAGDTRFDKSWKGIVAGCLLTLPIPIDDLIKDLPLVQQM
jgi:hypothetical protein